MTTKTTTLTVLQISARILRETVSQMGQVWVCSEIWNDRDIQNALDEIATGIEKLEKTILERLGK